jgi:hypothetical protein
VKGGQTAWPAADRELTFGLSPSNRYSVRPSASTSVGPSDVCLTEIADAAAVLGKALVELAPLVATITAMTPTAITVMAMSGNRMRLISVCSFFQVWVPDLAN